MKMKLRFGAALVALLLLSPVGSAATKQVEVGDRSFDPVRVTVGVGDIVEWHNPGTPDPHNIRQDERLFNSGDPVHSGDFRVAFSAGSFHYFCDIHGGRRSGMAGRIVVPVDVAARPAGPTFSVTWATRGSDSGSRFDVQYRIGSGGWRDWHKNATKLKGTFGEAGSPEVVVPGTRYRFRARSQRGANGQATSDWSPVASITP